MQVFVGHTSPITCGDFTPDGKRIITADEDGTLIFWDPRSAAPVFRLTAQDARFDLGSITAVAVNPASTLAVVGGAAGSVRVVSLSKGDVVGALGGHGEDDTVEAIAFVDLTGAGQVGTGGVVVTGATDGKACIWDLSTMRLRATLEHEVRAFRDVDCGQCSCVSAGRDNNAAEPPGTKIAPHRIGIGGQDVEDVGRADRHISQGAQGTPRSHPWCGSRPARPGCHQCRR